MFAYLVFVCAFSLGLWGCFGIQKVPIGYNLFLFTIMKVFAQVLKNLSNLQVLRILRRGSCPSYWDYGWLDLKNYQLGKQQICSGWFISLYLWIRNLGCQNLSFSIQFVLLSCHLGLYLQKCRVYYLVKGWQHLFLGRIISQMLWFSVFLC